MPAPINTLKGMPGAAGEGSSPGTPRSAHPTISRTPSTTTVTQSRLLAGSGKQPLPRAFRSSSGSQRRPPAPTRPTSALQDDDEYALGHDGPSDSASEDEPPSRSQAFRRPPTGKKPALKTLSSDGDAEDDEEDSSGGYLPFAAAAPKAGKDDPTATLRGSPRKQNPPTPHPPGKGKARDDPPPESSASSASSAQPPPSSSESATSNRQQDRPGPISPKHRAQLTNLSPRSGKDGSEGERSMGSSFSDLDDASVTQSALEDALLSGMQHGNVSMGSIASRVGRFGDVLRKR